MKKTAICLALGMALAPTAGSAQIMIDTTKITCGDLAGMGPADADMVAAWFSGWFNQKLGYTQVDLDAFHRNIASVEKYCAAHPNDQLFGVIQASVNQMMKKQ
ncbi:HdeA/HdeB family chaperone [Rhodoblastus sp. 17X3]|uniref:HdeA/HdeB family chaperone n=1 Tax=Rhodoblastus sp. 17X3 TaxID=3047026 RepID=UPI0024B6A0AC|nr:HdeA/HdeB family chaperone [Rhodoblastus sp. 17X3]MDI9849203.1 HdeA/HdeB family chaperone [Rhodoblastus sp. 17X3]